MITRSQAHLRLRESDDLESADRALLTIPSVLRDEAVDRHVLGVSGPAANVQFTPIRLLLASIESRVGGQAGSHRESASIGAM